MTPSDNLNHSNEILRDKFNCTSGSKASDFKKKHDKKADKADKLLDEKQKAQQPKKK